MSNFISRIFSSIARGFSEDYFWNVYIKANKYNGLLHNYYTFKYMRIASRCGGYIGRTTSIKGKMHLPHGFNGIHISRFAEIGDNVTIYQNVTIGQSGGGAPIVGNDVIIGANVCIIGNISVGNNVTIGAGTVVYKSIPDNCTVVNENAIRIIKH